MTWLATPSGTRRQSLSKRPFGAAVCPQATFDGGPEDPRALVAEYQVLMRADLFADLTEEYADERRQARWQAALAACRSAVAACEDGLRWLWLSPPRRADGTLAVASQRGIDEVPATVESIDSAALAKLGPDVPGAPDAALVRANESSSEHLRPATRSRPSSAATADHLADRSLALAA